MIRFRTGRPTHRRRRMNPPAHPDNGRRTEHTAYIQYGNRHHHPADPAQRHLRHVGNRTDLGPPFQPRTACPAGKRRRAARAPDHRGSRQVPLDHPDRHHAHRHPHGYLLRRCAGCEIRPRTRSAGYSPAHGDDRGPSDDRRHRHLPDAHLRRTRSQAYRHEHGREDRLRRRAADACTLGGGLAIRMAAFAQHRGDHSTAGPQRVGQQGDRGGDPFDHPGERRRRRSARGRTADRRTRLFARRPRGRLGDDAPQ